MSEGFEEKESPKVLRFLNDYRKKLSLLKIKSFYANHLCKRNCLEGKLLSNNETCLKQCDEWLNSYYDIKTKKNPDQEEVILLSSSEIPEAQRADYERGVARMRLSINDYLQELDAFVEEKIQRESRKK